MNNVPDVRFVGLQGSDRDAGVHFEDRHAFENTLYVLKTQGIDVWDRGVVGGKPLADQLREAIASCECAVFVATSRSVASPWCLGELGAFWGAGKPVVIYIADHTIADRDLPPQLTGHVWVATLPDLCRSIKAAHDRDQRREVPVERVPGLRLFQHRGYYPIVLSASNEPSIDTKMFGDAIDFLLAQSDRLAAMDLVYLREDNSGDGPDVVPDSHLARYDALVEKYRLHGFISDFDVEKKRVFRNYIRLVDDMGKTLEGVFLEILLHDVRNPIKSIIAAQNSDTVSRRKIGDASTRFVVQYVRDQGRHLIAAMEGGSKVAYVKQFSRTKKVKATTTPIYDDRYGLVGILCVNIDVEGIEQLDESGRQAFFENYTRNSGKTPQFELDQWKP